MDEIRKILLNSGSYCCGLILVCLVLITACNESIPAKDPTGSGSEDTVFADVTPDRSKTFTYHLASPDHKVLLPPILREISGIAVYDSVRLAGIQDEDGRIFIFRIRDGLVEKTVPFSKHGDYEDITVVKDRMYVLKSNGNIYRIDHFNAATPSVTLFTTSLTSRNDCEGLCYDPFLNALLIACKGSPSLKKDQSLPKQRAVYKFIFATSDIDTIPFLLINTERIARGEPLDWYQGISARMASRLSQNGSIVFQPSGIALHPVTGNLYILAHVGKMILIVDRKGSILHYLSIDPAILPQPEGICFDTDGVLYIASEGVEAEAVLAVYCPEEEIH